MRKELLMNRRNLPSLTGKRLIALILALILCLTSACAMAEGETQEDPEAALPSTGDWVTFILVCNEGMNNQHANVGNTMMVVGMNPVIGKIRLMMFTWDTFIRYPGYDVPQKIDMPFRNNGPEETVNVFNANFDMDIKLFMSLNYLNLASMIDSYGGVNVDVSRAERNALNGMVSSKKEVIQAQASLGILSQMVTEMLANDYYLNEYGPNTHLNGLQAVGFGWLQYDSVYNCCLREVHVIANLFESVATQVNEKVIFYTNETDYPDNARGRRVINLDDLTEDDKAYLRMLISPIFQMSYHNLTEDEIMGMSMTLARVAYAARRQGVDIFDSLEYAIMPLEARNEYDTVAGTKGHLVNYAENSKAIKEFLFGEREEQVTEE